MKTGRPITKIQHKIFGAMLLLTVFMTILTTAISIVVDINVEKKNLEDNLRNIAYTITESEDIVQQIDNDYILPETSGEYLDSIKESMKNVDVISIVSDDGIRLYHSNSQLIGTVYDGTVPDFDKHGDSYFTSDRGPSGPQRRVYVAVYHNGEYVGFVMVVLLNQNIHNIIVNTVFIHLCVATIIIALSIILSVSISRKIKHQLWGYEPDAFSAMYSVRDNILESFEEGVIAIDSDEKILFMNNSARKICGVSNDYSLNIKDYPMLSRKDIRQVINTGERLVGISSKTANNTDAIVSYYPVIEKDHLIGALAVLVDRSEYTKIAEDLSGVKFLVESMRANNHDFTNKLHVILGLIQMDAKADAINYITNVTTIQQEVLSYIMRNIEDPSVAALLIGKYSRAAELNVAFKLESGSQYRRNDVDFVSSDLVVVIGNLIENALEAIDSQKDGIRELSVGIFTKPGAMIVHVDDSGPGIPEDMRDTILDKGITTKGEDHGTGLFLVNQIVKRYNGNIEIESDNGVGTSFTVTLIDDKGGNKNV